MKNKENILPDFENEDSILDKIEKSNHFKVPEQYFESLHQVVNDNNLNTSFLSNVIDKLSYRILIPISAVVVVFVILFNFEKPSTETPLTDAQICDIIIEEDAIEIEDFLIYEVYSEVINESEELEESEDEELINYLLENDIDINSIMEEL
jgi:hypothetical protein